MIVVSLWFGVYMKQTMRTTAGSFAHAVQGLTDSDRIRSEESLFEASLSVVANWKPEELRALADPIIEAMQAATNVDQRNALIKAFAAIAKAE
jgi:hypothetical protein